MLFEGGIRNINLFFHINMSEVATENAYFHALYGANYNCYVHMFLVTSQYALNVASGKYNGQVL